MQSCCCTLSLPAIPQPPIGSVMAIAYRAPCAPSGEIRARVVKATKVMKVRQAPAPEGRNPMKATKAKSFSALQVAHEREFWLHEIIS